VKIGLSAEAEMKLSASILAAHGELTGRVKASIEGELGKKWTAEFTKRRPTKSI
jgi:hypothetical protein